MSANENRRRAMLDWLNVWLRLRPSRTKAMGELAAVDCPRHDDTSDIAMNDEHVWDLIARHWAEQLGPGEEAALEAWAAESLERGVMLRGARRILDWSRHLGDADETELAWERVRGRLHNAPSTKQGPRFSHPMFGARADAERRPLDATRRVRVLVWAAAAATLVLSTGIALRYRQAARSSSAPASEWATHAGERVMVELEDGSRVMLGPDTRLRVASADFKRERTLRLQGIAHFAVAHDPSHPFTVLAGGSSAQAVGTAFAVRGYPEDASVRVVVSEGRVLLRSAVSRTAPSALLGPGDAGRASADGVMSVERDVDLDQSLGWMRGRLRYSMATAADVARDLDRWYGVAIVLDDSALAAIHVTTSFDPAWTAADAVQRFADLLGATSETRKDSIHLSRGLHRTVGTPQASSTSRTEEARP